MVYVAVNLGLDLEQAMHTGDLGNHHLVMGTAGCINPWPVKSQTRFGLSKAPLQSNIAGSETT